MMRNQPMLYHLCYSLSGTRKKRQNKLNVLTKGYEYTVSRNHTRIPLRFEINLSIQQFLFKTGAFTLSIKHSRVKLSFFVTNFLSLEKNSF